MGNSNTWTPPQRTVSFLGSVQPTPNLSSPDKSSISTPSTTSSNRPLNTPFHSLDDRPIAPTVFSPKSRSLTDYPNTPRPRSRRYYSEPSIPTGFLNGSYETTWGQLVKTEVWKKIRDTDYGNIFYNHLLALADDDLKATFEGVDVPKQAHMITSLAGALLDGKIDEERLHDVFLSHSHLRITQRHYLMFKSAWMSMMQEVCGPELVEREYLEWEKALNFLLESMQTALSDNLRFKYPSTSMYSVSAVIDYWMKDPTTFPTPKYLLHWQLDRDYIPQWGEDEPLESYITTKEELDKVVKYQFDSSNRFIILETSPINKLRTGKSVRSSGYLAGLLQSITRLQSMCIPLWSIKIQNPSEFMKMLTYPVGVIVQGDHLSESPTIDYSSDSLLQLGNALLLMRRHTRVSQLFTGSGQQLAYRGLARLLGKAIREITAIQTQTLSHMDSAHVQFIKSLKSIALNIDRVGRSLPRVKTGGYLARQFVIEEDLQDANTTMIPSELVPFKMPNRISSTLPLEMLDKYNTLRGGIKNTPRVDATRPIKVIECAGKSISIEAVVFLNWAFSLLHDRIQLNKYFLMDFPSIHWLADLPSGIEVLASSRRSNGNINQVAIGCIYYFDPITEKTLRTFTTAFHPEISPDPELQDLETRPDNNSSAWYIFMELLKESLK